MTNQPKKYSQSKKSPNTKNTPPKNIRSSRLTKMYRYDNIYANSSSRKSLKPLQHKKKTAIIHRD
jgi:hypothetical protein